MTDHNYGDPDDRRVILSPHDVIVDRRHLDRAIDQLLDTERGGSRMIKKMNYSSAAGYCRAGVKIAIQDLRRMRDRARTE